MIANVIFLSLDLIWRVRTVANSKKNTNVSRVLSLAPLATGFLVLVCIRDLVSSWVDRSMKLNEGRCYGLQEVHKMMQD